MSRNLDKIKAVFFDFGGTLVNSNTLDGNGRRKAIEKFLRIYKLDYEVSMYLPLAKDACKKAREAQDKKFNSLPLKSLDSQKSGEFYVETFCKELLLLIGKGSKDNIIKQMYKAYLNGVATSDSLFPGTKETLGLLKEKYKLGVISNDMVEHARKPLRYSGLTSIFDLIVISGAEGVGIIKPDAEIFLRALRRLKVKPEEAVMVGDSLADDVKGAKNIGMISVWIDRSGKKRNLSSEPDFIINDIKDLCNYLCLGDTYCRFFRLKK